VDASFIVVFFIISDNFSLFFVIDFFCNWLKKGPAKTSSRRGQVFTKNVRALFTSGGLAEDTQRIEQLFSLQLTPNSYSIKL